MAQISPQFAETIQKKHNFVYWKIYDKQKKVVDEQQKNISLADSIDQLQSTLENLTGDYCVVKFYASETKKGGAQPDGLDVTIKLNDPTVYHRNNNNQQGVSLTDFISLQEKFFEQKLELERARIGNLPEDKPSATDKLMEHLSEHIPTIIAAFMKPKETATIGAPASDINETLQKFAEVDPNYEQTLSKMANYIKENPSILNQIKAVIGA